MDLNTQQQFAHMCFIVCILLRPDCSVKAQIRYEKDTVYKFSEVILNSLEGKQEPDYAKAAVDFSFIGEYRQALALDAKLRTPYGTIKKSDSTYFNGFHPVDAAEYIITRAKDEQIIIINEAHHFPYHRTFISSLLKDLYDKGFRYYGVETLDYSDSTMGQYGYPTITTGYYTAEPQFGNLIREALRVGFEIFPYEARSVDSFSNPKVRELEQAKNIIKILEKDPSAKILIHAGYDHIREDSVGGAWHKAMAGRLRELTGINPFTIDQEVLTERSDPSLENPFYGMIKVDTPTIFLNREGRPFSGPEGTNYYDVRLAHPRTKYIDNRPDWIFRSRNAKRFYMRAQDLSVGFPCIIQVYKSGENMEIAIPVDVIELPDSQLKKPFVLSAGNYVALIKGRNGKPKRLPISLP